jgi:hypothetical protein
MSGHYESIGCQVSLIARISHKVQLTRIMREVTIPRVVKLSVLIGVGGWGWPMAMRVSRIGIAFWEL